MRALIYLTRTGEPVVELTPTSWGYDTGILATDKVTLDIPAYTARSKSLDMRKLLTPRKYSIALVDDLVRGHRVVPAAGSIEDIDASEDDNGINTWSLTCYGPERAIENGAKIRKFPGWPLVSGSTRKPTGTYDLTISGVQYGTIMKRLLLEAAKFPGGALPLDYEADRSGSRTRTYDAIDGRSVLDALDELSELVGGVEYDFQPYIDEFDKIRFRFVTGTDAARVITSPASGQVWNLGGNRQDVRGWVRRINPGSVATDAIFTGGKDDDSVMIAQSSSPTLIDDGWPRAERWDASHSSVSVQSTLQGWADGALGGVTETAKLEVRTKVARLVRHGDIVQIAAKGHWDMPDGETMWRILSVGRKSDSEDWMQISLVR